MRGIIMTYKAAQDLLELLNSIMEGKMLFLGKTTEEFFSIIKTLDNQTGIKLYENQKIKIRESYCQQIFFGSREPLIINDSKTHPFTSKLPITSELNIHSYIGVPVFYNDGEMFGTLCALDSKPANYTAEDVEVLVKFSNLFSYVIELEKQVRVDPLTGLYNRRYLYDNFEFISDSGTIMLLDLDGFKQVNDLHGHDIGDMVLIEVGKRLNKTIGIENLAVRLGGDEFVLVFPNQTDQISINEIGNTLIEVLSDWSSFGYSIQVSASIGIVPYPQEGTELKTLLTKADSAMYLAKMNGKSAYHLY
jgi:diguanylate cyclase